MKSNSNNTIKLRLIISSFITILACLFFACQQPHTTINYDQPTDGSKPEYNTEKEKEGFDKKAWIDSMHKGALKTDWRTIEHQTLLDKYYTRLHDRNSQLKMNTVNIDDGILIGNWKERGSTNQAGSIHKTAYDSKNQKLYAIADGGSIWRGSIDGINWELVIDELRFDRHFLEVVFPNPNSDNSRLLASINGVPYFFETLSGWKRAGGINPSISRMSGKDQISVNNGKDIFYMATDDFTTKVSLYHSEDFGANYTLVREMEAEHVDDVAMHAHKNSQTFYLIEESNSTFSNVYKWNNSTKNIDVVRANSRISFGDNIKANIDVVKRGNQEWLYLYDQSKTLFRSRNQGSTWEPLAKINDFETQDVRIFDGGLFVSDENPDLMIICGVNAHISRNGGVTWEIINHWSDYYDNTSGMLHADIMYVDEYDIGNDKMITISNHGGISTSFNQAYNFGNIGLEGLNVSQYYSVTTIQDNNVSDYILAGSQDQGLQRTKELGENLMEFEQIFGGDFGHLLVTNQKRSLWTMAPKGVVYYFPDIKSPNTSIAWSRYFDYNRPNEVWLPPMIINPLKPNSVFIGGGSVEPNNNGSYVLELNVTDIGTFEMRQNTFDFSTYGGEISALGLNQVDGSEMYALTTNGLFFKSTDGGKQFLLKEDGFPRPDTIYGHKILTSKKDSERVVISGSGYNQDPVFESTDGGESFQSISSGLPRTTVFDMEFSKGEELIFAATEAGPYVYVRKKQKWFDLSQGQSPNHSYFSVEYLEDDNIIRYGTYGRGIWDFEISEITSTEDVADVVKEPGKFMAYPNPTTGPLNIEYAQNGQFYLYNTSGRLIAAEAYQKDTQRKFDISHYANGIYYLIFDDGNNISSQILVKI